MVEPERENCQRTQSVRESMIHVNRVNVVREHRIRSFHNSFLIIAQSNPIICDSRCFPHWWCFSEQDSVWCPSHRDGCQWRTKQLYCLLQFEMFQSPGSDLSNLVDSGSFHQGSRLLAPWPSFLVLLLLRVRNHLVLRVEFLLKTDGGLVLLLLLLSVLL